MEKGQRVGYVRVSSSDQSTERQLADVEPPLDRIFTEKLSGKDTERPQLQEMLKYVRDGDRIVVHSLDRLARNLGDLLRIVQDLTSRGVTIEFRKEHLTFSCEGSPIDKLLLSVIGAVAEFERSLILERQREGIAIAKAAGRYKGGKRRLDDVQAAELRRRAQEGANKAALAREFGLSRRALYDYLGQVSVA